MCVGGLFRAVLPVLLISMMPGCGQHGVYGTVICKSIETDAATVFDVSGLGLAATSVAHDRALSLGWMRRTYLYPAGTKAAPASWGFCRGPDGALPVVADSRSTGIELSFSAPVAGISAGYSSSFVRMPVEEGRDVRLSYSYVRDRPDLARADLCEGDRCMALSPR